MHYLWNNHPSYFYSCLVSGRDLPISDDEGDDDVKSADPPIEIIEETRGAAPRKSSLMVNPISKVQARKRSVTFETVDVASLHKAPSLEDQDEVILLFTIYSFCYQTIRRIPEPPNPKTKSGTNSFQVFFPFSTHHDQRIRILAENFQTVIEKTQFISFFLLPPPSHLISSHLPPINIFRITSVENFLALQNGSNVQNCRKLSTCSRTRFEFHIFFTWN